MQIPVEPVDSHKDTEYHQEKDTPHLKSMKLQQMVGEVQTPGEQEHQSSSPTVVNMLSLMPGFKTWRSGKETGNPQGI